MGSVGGMAAGAGLGYGASPDGWGGAGAAGGAAAGLFGGAGIARAGARFMKNKGGFAGMGASAKHTMTGAYAGATQPPGSAWGSMQSGAKDLWGRAGQSISNMKGEWAKRRGA